MNSNHDSHPHPENFDNEGQHDFIMPKKNIFTKLILGIKFIDDLFYQMYIGLIGNFDATIGDMEISKFFKNILHSRQILLFYILVGNFWMIYQHFNFNNSDIDDEKGSHGYNMNVFLLKYYLYTACLILFGVTSFFIFLLKFGNYSQMIIKRCEELEKYIVSKNKDLKKNQCHECKVVRCMRSFHCNYCNKCVTKFELHSNWFNCCVGSQNLLIYSLTLVFLNFYFIICVLNYSLQIFIIERDSPLYDFKNNLFTLHFWFSLTMYLEIKLFSFTKGLIKRSIFQNFTENEKNNWKRLPYLWRNVNKEFFNPFNRGCWINLREVWVSFMNYQIDISEKINIDLMKNENLNETAYNLTVNEDKFLKVNSSTAEDDYACLKKECKEGDEKKSDDSERVTNYIKKLQSNYEYFLSFDNQLCYQTYDDNPQRNPVNWNRRRLYTVFDLMNSPFRKILIKSVN
jgi:hypothetical protein